MQLIPGSSLQYHSKYTYYSMLLSFYRRIQVIDLSLSYHFSGLRTMKRYIVLLFLFQSDAPIDTLLKIRRTRQEITLKTPRNNVSIFFLSGTPGMNGDVLP